MDSAATRGLVRRRLGVRVQAADPGRVAAGEVAKRLFDYVQQHPYVEQLKLAVFNPGNAELIADTLRLLEKRLKKLGRDTPPLRYAVQLFSADDHPEHLGSGLEALLDPDRQVGEDDEFTLRSSNPLLPKLVFARSTVEAYLKSPETFTAHVSLFIEQSALRGRVGSLESVRRGSFVRGLVQEPETTFAEHGAAYSWRKALRAATSERPAARERLLAELVAWSQRMHVSAATGEPAVADVAPVVEIHLEGEGRVLLDEVHRASDWVLTLDRHLGLEYFDQPSVAGHDAYLLDFAPEYLQEDRQRLMLTTRSTEELSSLLRPALDSHSLKLPRGEEPVVLEALRSLSGKLALRLLAAPGRSSEIIGLLLARWLLEQTGRLFERVIVPLDAHQRWFQNDDQDSVSRRADLLLVGFDPETTLLRISVVEVKMRESVTPGGSLYVDMHRQAEATVERLRRRFDPQLYAVPRADALLRAKELTTLLTFYVHRAQRYGLFELRAAGLVLDFLQHLDSGYRLEIETLGVIFEQNAETSILEEEEPGFPVYRFGHAAAQGLLDEACARNRRPEGKVRGVPEESPVGESSSLTCDPLVDSFGDRVGGRDKLTTTRGSLSRPRSKREEAVPEAPEVAERYPTRAELDKEGQPEAREVAEVAADANETAAAALVPAEERPYESAAVPPSEITDVPVPDPDILIGANEMTPQWGILGMSGSSQVALDLTGCNTISLFGVQGFGKSYTLGAIAEMAATSARGINRLPSPLATVIFHYHDSDAYPPEYVSAVMPNRKDREVRQLQSSYGAEPQGLEDVVVLTPEAKVEERRREFPGLDVRPIKFASAELGKKWRFLLGAYGNDALYLRQMMAIMRRYREDLTLEDLRREIADTELPKNTRRLAEDRIRLAEPYIDDSQHLSAILRPGRTVIVDLRDEWIEKEEALGLFVVMLEIFAKSQFDGQDFNKLVVFDEAHKYITESDLIAQVVRIIREMRHQRTSVVIASQDPLSVPRSVIELSTVLVLHRMTSPQWLRHLKSGIAALDNVTDRHLSVLRAGEALIWAQRCTDLVLTQRPRKIQIRPRFTQHGGGTKTAISGVTIR